MTQVFDVLHDRYRDLVARSIEEPGSPEFLESVLTFLVDARQAGEMLADLEERARLRAYMRFMAALLHEAGREAPPIGLMPLDRERWPARRGAGRAGAAAVPPWMWALVGAAALVVLAGLVVVGALAAGAVQLPSAATPLPPTATALPPSATPSPTSTPTPSPTPTPTARPATPVLSDLTIALGVTSPGEPLLVGETFDWNTRAVYALFDYSGMQDGLPWRVVWTREGEVVAEQHGLWDLEREGSSGTSWAVYTNPEGTVLLGGSYLVSLLLDDELQAEASFRIRTYVTPAP